MFAYCLNNPVMNRDTQGTLVEKGAGGGGGGGVIFYDGIGGGSSGGYSGGYSGGTAVDKIIATTAVVAQIALYGFSTESLRSEMIALRKRSHSISETQEKIEALAISATKSPNPQYYVAEVIDGHVTPIVPLNYSDAFLWASAGGNLLCASHSAALAIVRFYPSARWDPAHNSGKDGYLPHYHLSSAHTNHIWYL